MRILHLGRLWAAQAPGEEPTTSAAVTAALDPAVTAEPNPAKFDELASAFTENGGFIFERSQVTSGLLAVVFAGFMLHLAIEFWKLERLDFKPHLIRWFVFSLLILGYTPFAQTISGFVMSFGAVDSQAASRGNAETASFLAQQKKKFDQAKAEIEAQITAADDLSAQQQDTDDQGLAERVGNALVAGFDSSLSSLLFQVMRLVTEASFTFAAIALTFLKLLQGAMMKVIFSIGPFMIAFASWPGVTSRYLSAWASALIETSLWGLVAKIFIALMVTNTRKSGGDVTDLNFFTYIGLNVLYAASLLSVPAITTSLLRGNAGGGVTAAGMWGAAVGAAASTARMATSAGKTGRSLLQTKPDKSNEGGTTASGSSAQGAKTSGGDKPADRAADRAFHAKRGAINAQRKD